MIRIVLADDDAIIREGLKMIIESQPDLELLASATNGEEAITFCRELKPDVALLDIRMPIMDGIKAAEQIINENLSTPLLLTTFDEPDLILRALKAGVNGYILKNSPADRILSAIRVVHTGGTVFQADILDFIRGRISSDHSGHNNLFDMLLSSREMQIVELVAKGLSNKEIGEKLYISNGTVRNHISTIPSHVRFD